MFEIWGDLPRRARRVPCSQEVVSNVAKGERKLPRRFVHSTDSSSFVWERRRILYITIRSHLLAGRIRDASQDSVPLEDGMTFVVARPEAARIRNITLCKVDTVGS